MYKNIPQFSFDFNYFKTLKEDSPKERKACTYLSFYLILHYYFFLYSKYSFGTNTEEKKSKRVRFNKPTKNIVDEIFLSVYCLKVL